MFHVTPPEYPAPVIKITTGPPTAADLAPAADDDETTHSHDDSNTGIVVGVIIGVVVIAGVGGALVLRSKRRTRATA
jgi:hypothetical protein